MKHVKPAFLAFFIVFITMLFSCQTDDGYLETSKQIIPFHFESFTLNGKSLSKQHPKVSDRIIHLNNLARQKSVTASSIILDTTNIKVIQHADATSYIFRVKDSVLTGAVKNYVLVRLRDSLWHQYMVRYPLDAMQQVITSQTTIEPVFGDDLLQQFNLKCGGSSYQSVWVDGYTINHPCTGRGRHIASAGQYSESNPTGCQLWGTAGGPTVTVVFGHFETQLVAQEPCETIDSGASSGGGGGAGGSNLGNNTPPDDAPQDPDNSDPDETIHVGIVPNVPPMELIDPNEEDCIALNEFMNASDIAPGSTNRDYIYSDLRMHAINNDFEKGQLITESTINNQPQRNYTEVTGTVRSNGLVFPNVPHNGSLTGVIHTHWESDRAGNNLSSMFSLEDYLYFCHIVFRRHRSGKSLSAITFILVAHTGDVYALKASNPEKIIQYLSDFYANNVTTDEKELALKGFNRNISNERSQNLKEQRFLELVGAADVKMYQYSTDDNNWDQIVDDPSSNNRKPCN